MILKKIVHGCYGVYGICLMFQFYGCIQPEKADFFQDSYTLDGSLPSFDTYEGNIYLSRMVEQGTQASWVVQSLDGRWIDTIDQRQDWFVNWADMPKISVCRNGMLGLALRHIGPDHHAYTIDYYIRRQKEEAWKYYGQLPLDTSSTEHGFPSVEPFEDGWMVVWLDGGAMHRNGFMSLHSAQISMDGQVINRQLIDSTVCDCCQTDLVMAEGQPAVIFRNRTENEIRDVYWSVYLNGKWQSSQPVENDGWLVPGCPVNGPQIVNNNKTLVCSWFTAAQDTAAIKMRILSEPESDVITLEKNFVIGRIAMEAMDTQGFGLAYFRADGKEATLKIQTFDWSGKPQSAWEIAPINPSRNSGFPTLGFANGKLSVAWTQWNDPEYKIKIKTFNL